MKCPRCETENGTRSVCMKCGMFLYDGRSRNRRKLSQRETAKLDAKRAWRIIKQVFKYTWMLIVLVVLSYLLVLAAQYFSGG